jgi:hypothetical protein
MNAMLSINFLFTDNEFVINMTTNLTIYDELQPQA